MDDNKFLNKPPLEEDKKDTNHAHRNTEVFYANKIDNSHFNEIFSRKEDEPNSLFSYWKRIMIENNIPISEEEQKKYFLLNMDNVNFGDYYKNRLASDKNYTENGLTIDFENRLKDPTKFNEKLLERVYAYCLARVFLKKDVIFGGDNEEISLESCVKTHPYDLYKRQVQQILSIEDERFPRQKFNIGLGVQWGHEKTSEEAIKYRLSYIVNGIVDYNSMTEICYTTTQENEKMPTQIPLVVIGGDIKNVTYLIDRVMKDDYSEIAKSSIVYNTLVQIKTQLDLFYDIALKQEGNYLAIPSNLNEQDRNNFIIEAEKVKNNIKIYASMKNIIDQVLEANDPYVKKAKPDSIHEKIINACKELAKERGVELL